jgi:hypothetical protein
MIGYIDDLNLAVSIADLSQNELVISRATVSPVIVQSVSKTQLLLIHPQTIVPVVVCLRTWSHHDRWRRTSCASEYKLPEMYAKAIVRHHTCAQYMLVCQLVLVKINAADDGHILVCVVGATRCVHIVPCHSTVAHGRFA